MVSGRPPWVLPGREMGFAGGTRIMGVINVTPDSFSDGGKFQDHDAAVAQGLRLADEGADILDVGGESSRPGSQPVSAVVEIDRVIPVIRQLAERSSAVISVDTTKAEVAAAALDAGATVINDISALRVDPEMAPLAAKRRAGVVLMHMLGTPRTMQDNPTYKDVVAEVCDFLAQRLRAAVAAGIDQRRVVLDPGIGFGKTLEHNLLLVRHLKRLHSLGRPVLLGASRKAFLGVLTGRREADQRLWSSLGVHVLGAALGADIVRVHDVAPVREALLVGDAVMAAGGGL